MADYDSASRTSAYTRRWVLSSIAVGTGGSVAAVATGGVVRYVLPSTKADSTAVLPAAERSSASLAAPKLTRSSGVISYPPVVEFERPVEWIERDVALMQRSQDPTFQRGVSEAAQIMYAATISYDFGLSSVVSGSWFFRMAAWRGTRPADNAQNWSNIVNVGDTVAPTITTNASQSAMSIPLTADEGVTWAIVGGAQSAEWEISGTNLVPVSGGVASAVSEIAVEATDFADNSTTKTITNTLDIAPTAFTFTDVGQATPATQYTSNVITVSGLGSGVTAKVTISGGTYSKNGAAYTSAAGTATNGDTFAVRLTSGGSASSTGAVLTIGSVLGTYTVATAGMAWAKTTGFDKYSGVVLSATHPTSAEIVSPSATTGVRAASKIIPDKFHLEFTIEEMATSLTIGFDLRMTDYASPLSLAFPWEAPGSYTLTLYENSSNNPVGTWTWGLLDRSVEGSTTGDGFGTSNTHAVVVGDVVVMEATRSTGQVSLWRVRSSTPLFIGTFTSAVFAGQPDWYAIFQNYWSASVTINGGHTAFAMTPTSGYSAAAGS